jgi:hypothetical protein
MVVISLYCSFHKKTELKKEMNERYEVPMAGTMEIIVIWDVMPYEDITSHQNFGKYLPDHTASLRRGH